MLKIEDVKVGDELVWVSDNADGFEKGITYTLEAIQRDRTIAIRGFSGLWSPSILKYFKKKEQSQYTFDDLIDASSKAVKDGVFKLIKTDFKSVIALFDNYDFDAEPPVVFHNGEHNHVNCEYIQSLYKETFVIETEEDIQKIQAHRKSDLPLLDKQMSKAILENGNEILIFRVDSESPHVCRYMRNGLYMNYLDIEVLKGATVEQERGRDDRS